MKMKTLIMIPLLLTVMLALMASSVFGHMTSAGTQIRNRSAVTFEDMTGNSFGATSNEVITLVLPFYGVSILPKESGETPPVTPAYKRNALAGLTVYSGFDFVNTIRHDGNAADAIDVLVDGSSTIPGSWSVLLLQSDGVTPLADTGFDGIPDVGPLAQGDSVGIVVRLMIPSNGGSGGPYDAIIRASSTNDPGASDTTTNRILNVFSTSVDIGNYGQLCGSDCCRKGFPGSRRPTERMGGLG
jgi:hypothetical protein